MPTTKTLDLSRYRLALAAMTLAIAGGAWQAAQAAPGGPHGGMMGGPVAGGPMGGPFGGRGFERMLDEVNASTEQRQQVRQIMQAAAADLRTQREAGRALHEQMMQLFAQPTVDARAAEALRQQQLAQHDKASQRMMQAMLDVSRVLTPEQRQQIAERMKERRTMMERHQRERQQQDRRTQ